VRPGVAFPHQHPHEAAHLGPLMARLTDLLVVPPTEAAVIVQADTKPPVAGAWNVQLFHGLGDKGYTGNPLFLQKGRMPRFRTALNLPLAMLGLPAPFLRPPARPGKKRSRYQQVNAYGPRWADWFDETLSDVQITRFGHVALNDMEGLSSDPEGPVVWMPTWDNRRFLGGRNQSSLHAFAADVARIAHSGIPFIVKFHPLTVRRRQSPMVRRMLEQAPNVTVAPADSGPYSLLQGCRGVLTDTSSIGFEAYAMGFPVAVLRPSGVRHKGLHKELADRVPVFDATRPGLEKWAESPEHPADARWARDLMDPPRRKSNDAFAAQLRQKVVESLSGAKW
jgi:hypothetical protein